MTTIAVLGGGRIGSALIAGLLRSGTAPEAVTVTTRTPEHAERLAREWGISAITDNVEAVTGADIVFLCVHPDQLIEVAEEIAEAASDNEPAAIVVSMAAGVTLDSLQHALGAGAPAVRVMPNTPMTVGKGVCAVAGGCHVASEQLDLVCEVLESTGSVVRVDEADLDAVTALAGSAPGYFFLVTEALIDAGVALGLRREVAAELAAGTAAGAGEMLAQQGASAVALREAISSPGGTTVAALRSLEESGLRGAFFRATEACVRRSQELGAPAGEGQEPADE